MDVNGVMADMPFLMQRVRQETGPTAREPALVIDSYAQTRTERHGMVSYRFYAGIEQKCVEKGGKERQQERQKRQNP